MSSQDPKTMSKQELLATEEQAFNDLFATISGLTPAQAEAPASEGGWTVKDHTAHLVEWEKNTIRRLEQHGASIADEYGDDDDATNEMFYQRNKDRPLAEVVADFHATREQLRTMIESLPDEAVTTSGYHAWLPKHPLTALLAGDTYGHYADHLGYMQAYLEGLKKEADGADGG